MQPSERKKNWLTQQLNLDLLASNLLWFVSAPSLSLSPNLSDIDYSFNSLGRSLMFESINVTLHTLQQLSDISDLWNDRLAKQLQKKSESTRHWFDDSYMFIIIRNELVYYLSPVLSLQQSIPLIIQPSLDSPDQFIYQNRIIGDYLKLRNPPLKKKKNRTNPLVLLNSTLFTFCSLSSEKNQRKQQTQDISFSSMSAVPAATARSPNLFHTFFYNLKNSFNLNG